MILVFWHEKYILTIASSFLRLSVSAAFSETYCSMCVERTILVECAHYIFFMVIIVADKSAVCHDSQGNTPV
jgi:hypothetical protein